MEPIHLHSMQSLFTLPFSNSANKRSCLERLGDMGRWANTGRFGYNWLGTMDASVAERRVTRGWKEGADVVLKNMEDMEVAPPMNVQRRIVRGDQGDELDIHTVNRGALDRAWSLRKRRHARGVMAVRLVVQVNLLANMTSRELFCRGAAAVKLTDLLTAAGYNVEIVGAIASYPVRGVSGDFLCTFPLKEAQASLDVERLAGVVCNAGFHRLIGFRTYYAMAPDWHQGPGGASSDTGGRILERYIEDSNDGRLAFVTPYDLGTLAQASAWVAAMINTLDHTD